MSGGAALSGYTLFGHYSQSIVAATMATAAGAILAMLADTMIPEAFEEAHDFAGIITVAGFLCAFMLSKSDEDSAKKTIPEGKPVEMTQRR